MIDPPPTWFGCWLVSFSFFFSFLFFSFFFFSFSSSFFSSTAFWCPCHVSGGLEGPPTKRSLLFFFFFFSFVCLQKATWFPSSPFIFLISPHLLLSPLLSFTSPSYHLFSSHLISYLMANFPTSNSSKFMRGCGAVDRPPESSSSPLFFSSFPLSFFTSCWPHRLS